jgi:mannose-6-phosphate isomerase
MSVKPYPLKFQPVFKVRVWGGRALERFGFELPPGPIGEGWMIADHPNGVSRVVNGPLAGEGLDAVRQEYGKDWFGIRGSRSGNGRFPLLIKLLDCNDDLSVQVHPGDDYAGLPEGELGKTEMWYVLSAKPDAKIICGLKPGVNREQLEQAMAEGRIMETLNVMPVHAGDTFYIPAGTVHALCAGVVVAEIQQNSDTTYRLYDYGRPGLDGKPRELHIEDSLNVTNFDSGGHNFMNTNEARPGEWMQLAASPYFMTEKGVVRGPWHAETSPESFAILIVAEGEGTVSWADGMEQAKAGDCFLLPSPLGKYVLDGQMTVLRSQVP